jgi:hypothetical protein
MYIYQYLHSFTVHHLSVIAVSCTRGESSPQDTLVMVINISSQFKTSEHHNRIVSSTAAEFEEEVIIY